MANVYFIGCLHLGHHWMAKYRGFKDSEEHDNYLIEKYNSVVGRKDVVYLLGDLTMETSEHYYKLDLLNGRKKVILGNHDNPRDIPKLLDYVESVAGMTMYKGIMLTHAPVHPCETSFCSLAVHAHIHHENELEDCKVPPRYGDLSPDPESTIHKYFNVDAHKIGYTPVSLEYLKEHIIKQGGI